MPANQTPAFRTTTAIMAHMSKALPNTKLTFGQRTVRGKVVMDVTGTLNGKGVTRTLEGATLDHVERCIAQIHVGISLLVARR